MRTFLPERKQEPVPSRATLRGAGWSRGSLAGQALAQPTTLPFASATLQTKLAVNEPGDEYEQEADRISQAVMRAPGAPPKGACGCGGGCPKCRVGHSGEAHEKIQTKR